MEQNWQSTSDYSDPKLDSFQKYYEIPYHHSRRYLTKPLLVDSAGPWIGNLEEKSNKNGKKLLSLVLDACSYHGKPDKVAKLVLFLLSSSFTVESNVLLL